jgi:predicted nuclease of predicted toxin-antitoxin system
MSHQQLRWVADENFPMLSFRVLLANGWDITHIGLFSGGVPDTSVLDYAIAENRIVLTFDSDHGRLIFRDGYRPPGVVYFRLTDYLPDEPGRLLLDMNAENWPFVGNLCVIDNDARRIRPIPYGMNRLYN